MARRLVHLVANAADRMELAQQIAPHDFHRRAAIVGCALADVAICGYDAVRIAPVIRRTERMVNGSGLRRASQPRQDQTAAATAQAKALAAERRRQMAVHLATDPL